MCIVMQKDNVQSLNVESGEKEGRRESREKEKMEMGRKGFCLVEAGMRNKTIFRKI